MKKPEIPNDEQARLSTLRAIDILDTPAEERFDRLTRMAKRLFNVPIALVSLTDEKRQWFKSCIGLDANEGPRETSFCGHAILDNKIFIIPNAIADPRFADNPSVLGAPNIRFYAGCPLIVDGYKLGALCIMDRTPRSLDDNDLETLKDLAYMVERELGAVQLAMSDHLTNLSNRRGFLMLARHSLALSVRERSPVTLVFLDLDKFKPINDQFGHAEGDAALIAFSTLLKSTFRDTDVCARLGGDEFVLLLTNTTTKQAVEIIGRLKQLLCSYNLAAKRGYELLFSYGIVEFDSVKHSSVEELLVDGDSIMYELKKSRK